MKCIHCDDESMLWCCKTCREKIGDEPRAIHVKALSGRVLVVAVQRLEGWVAYCDAVPGWSHDQEYQEVMRTGDKILKDDAIALFGNIGTGPYIP